MNSSNPGAAGSMKIHVIADGYQINIGNGEPLILHLDGKDYPREPIGIAKAVGADAVSARRVNPHTIETSFANARGSRRDSYTRGLRRWTCADGDHRLHLSRRREAAYGGGIRQAVEFVGSGGPGSNPSVVGHGDREVRFHKGSSFGTKPKSSK